MQSPPPTQGSSKPPQMDDAHGKAAKLTEKGLTLLESDGIVDWEGAGLGEGDLLANPKRCL